LIVFLQICEPLPTTVKRGIFFLHFFKAKFEPLRANRIS